MNKAALKSKMALNNDTGILLSKALGITNTTLSDKMNEKSEFTRKEIKKIKERYKLNATEIDNIFFSNSVTY